ncbi:MAG: hypothetical protein F6K50_53320 [Moorea sp. SIO3I7]|nr:hypothetical protein [Moorena sp. SIO3I7]
MASGKSQTPAILSYRELQIIEHVAAGLTNLEIAHQLAISIIKSATKQGFRKLRSGEVRIKVAERPPLMVIIT